MKEREIFIETTRYGNALRVVAVDAETATEVVFQAPLKASRADLQRLAADKLHYVLDKQAEDGAKK